VKAQQSSHVRYLAAPEISWLLPGRWRWLAWRCRTCRAQSRR